MERQRGGLCQDELRQNVTNCAFCVIYRITNMKLSHE